MPKNLNSFDFTDDEVLGRAYGIRYFSASSYKGWDRDQLIHFNNVHQKELLNRIKRKSWMDGKQLKSLPPTVIRRF